MIKKYYRIFFKYISYLFLKFLKIFLFKSNFKILPPIADKNEFNYDYSPSNRRVVLRKDNNKFGKVIFDSSLFETELCHLGKKYFTNKSGLNLNGHRSGYTGLYFLLFFHLKFKKCAIAEIGIAKNASTKLWRSFFSKASIDCFELDEKLIKQAKKHKLKSVKYHFIDVNNKKIINDQFKKTKKKFDIIIDDSTHVFDHQINIIKSVMKYLKSGGFLIIEDIYRFRKEHAEKQYYYKLKNLQKHFSEILFVDTSHANNFTASWKCEKILLLIKK